jgi:hypothetical protein
MNPVCQSNIIDRLIMLTREHHYSAPTLLAGLVMSGELRALGYPSMEGFLQQHGIPPSVGREAGRIVLENIGAGQASHPESPQRAHYPPLQVQLAVRLGFLPAEPDGEAPFLMEAR